MARRVKWPVYDQQAAVRGIGIIWHLKAMNTVMRVETFCPFCFNLACAIFRSLDQHLHVQTEFPGANDNAPQQLDRALTRLW